jgi:hypothetical protein
MSSLCLDSPGLPDGVSISARVIAAHGDSVLAGIQTRCDPHMTTSARDDNNNDYFIYCAGDAV